MRQINYFLLLLVIIFGTAACGGSQDKKKDAADRAEKEKSNDKVEETSASIADEDVISGTLKVKLGDKSVEINRFLKNKTDLTLNNKSAVFRIHDETGDMWMTILMPVDQLINGSGKTFSTSQADASNGVTFIGFNEPGNPMDQIWIKEGTITVVNFDEESLATEMKFEGTGGKITDIKNENTVDISADLALQIDNVLDVRK